jgi:isopenicillin N synthase-like dioxygenase
MAGGSAGALTVGRGRASIMVDMIAGLPILDMRSLLGGGDEAAREALARDITAACRDSGFFYVVGHGVAPALLQELAAASRRFFALPPALKQEIGMARGGRAWRGWFPVGGELTGGAPDRKEGLYFGSELPPEHPRVRAGVPMHGANLFPAQVPELRAAVLDYMAAMTTVAQALLVGIARSLGLASDYFVRHYTAEPTVLFRVFHYPSDSGAEAEWGVGEHTDYGLLTLLAQDEVGGLQVKTPRGWIDAPPIAGALVCNIGDMLDRLTGGEFRSTPHRVRNVSGRSRLSFPFFFDPDFAAEVLPLPRDERPIADDQAERWDRASVHLFRGSYGDYLLAKVGRVFPELRAATGAQP